MASVTTSALIAEIRGKVGGNVFARNKGGLYVRAKIKPLNPRSVLQQTRRAIAAAVASHWGTITQQQRDDWQAYAVNTSWTNRLGASINIGGEAAFVRLNAMNVLIGEAIDEAAPLAYGHAEATDFTITASEADAFAELVEPSTGWSGALDDTFLCIFAAMPQPQSRDMAPNRYQFLQVIEGNTAVPIVFPYELSAWPWTFFEDQKLTIGAVSIDVNNRMSIRTFASVVAGA